MVILYAFRSAPRRSSNQGVALPIILRRLNAMVLAQRHQRRERNEVWAGCARPISPWSKLAR
jgi:hypothetical protein